MLQFVLGRAGSGKTEYVFSSIKRLIDEDNDNILLITPEQFSFVAERKLLYLLGEANVNKVENSSFSRLALTINDLYGTNSLPTLTKGGKAIMMHKAIDSIKDSLQLYNHNYNDISFINAVIKIYDEMKSCRVSSDDILSVSNSIEKEILSKKLYDISNIIGTYDALIKDEYFDSANELTRLYETALNLDYFKDRIVFIDGFSGFVAQEYKVLEIILKQAKKVYITLCTDSFENNNKYDLFSYVNSNIRILKAVAKDIDVEIDSPIYLDKNHRAKNEQLKSIEKYTFINNDVSYDEVPNNIEIYAAKSITDECDRVASDISKLLRQGYLAKDISVICRDLDKYENQLNFSFDKFNIPYFDDQRQPINTQPLIMFVNFLLRVGIYSFRSDDIFSLLKTNLTKLSNENIALLENYVFTWSINGSKWKNDFTQSTKGFVEEITENDKIKVDEINDSRKYVVDRLTKFINFSKNKSCREISKNIYYTLLDFGCDEQLKELAIGLEDSGKSALANEQGRIWDLLMEILNQLALTSDDRPITLKEYYKLFNLVISNEDLGMIPTGLDNVQLGSADRLRADNPKIVFVLGANEGEFPQAVTSSGLLTESDRIELISNDFKLYSYGETLNAQERYFAYMAISSPSEKLYVSFVQGNEKNAESSIVTGIKALYPNIKYNTSCSSYSIDSIESIDKAFEILASNFNENTVFIKSLKQYFYNREDYKSKIDAVERLVNNGDLYINNKNNIRKLYGDNMFMSASRVERYYNCAFSYFCQYGLNARPRKKAEMDPMQTGTVIHYVLEQIIKENGKNAFVEMSKQAIKVAINKHLTTFLETKMGNAQNFTARFKYLFMRLSKMLCSVVERLQNEFLQSDFEPIAFELEIGKNREVGSKVIELDNGCKIEISGAIDRVDTYEENGKKYIRVVDYKSGTKNFSCSDILYGINLQMFIYLFTVCDSDTKYSGIPAAVLYMHSARNVYNSDNHSMSDIAKRDNKNYVMQGLVVNDEENELAIHMEKDLGNVYIPVKETKSGLSGNIVDLEQMGIIAKEIDSLIKNMGDEIYNGQISQYPITDANHKDICQYCDYAFVCKNRKELKYKELVKYTNEEALQIMRGDSSET